MVTCVLGADLQATSGGVNRQLYGFDFSAG